MRGCLRACEPRTKKVARCSRSASSLLIFGVNSGSGPSSKVNAKRPYSRRVRTTEPNKGRVAPNVPTRYAAAIAAKASTNTKSAFRSRSTNAPAATTATATSPQASHVEYLPTLLDVHRSRLPARTCCRQKPFVERLELVGDHRPLVCGHGAFAARGAHPPGHVGML